MLYYIETGTPFKPKNPFSQLYLMIPTSLKLNILSPYGKHLIFSIFLVEIKLKWLFGLAKPFNLYVLQVYSSLPSHTFLNSLFQNLVNSTKLFPPSPAGFGSSFRSTKQFTPAAQPVTEPPYIDIITVSTKTVAMCHRVGGLSHQPGRK